MTRDRQGWRAAGLAALLLAGGLAPAAADRSRLSILHDKLQSIMQQIFSKQTKLKETVQKQEKASDQLDEAQKKLDAAQDDLEASRKRLAAAKVAAAEAARRLAAAEQKLKAEQKHFGRRIAASTVQGPVSYADVLLGAQDLGDFLDREYCVERVMAQDALAVNALRAARHQVAVEHAALFSRQQQLATAHTELARREQRLAQARNEQKQLLAKIKDQRQDQEQELESLEQDSNQVEREVAAEERRRQGLRKSQPGKYRPLPPWPGRWLKPTAGGFGSGFGMRFHPILKIWRMHTGLDIGGAYGQSIVAAASGEVFFAAWKGGYGKCIIILHGSGMSTLYGHCSRIVVGPGQSVRRGQIIGYVGSTGLSTAPHLHFEVRRNGVPINPL